MSIYKECNLQLNHASHHNFNSEMVYFQYESPKQNIWIILHDIKGFFEISINDILLIIDIDGLVWPWTPK